MIKRFALPKSSYVGNFTLGGKPKNVIDEPHYFIIIVLHLHLLSPPQSAHIEEKRPSYNFLIDCQNVARVK